MDNPKFYPHGLKVGDEIKVYNGVRGRKPLQSSTIIHVEKDWFIAMEGADKFYKIWNTGKRELIDKPTTADGGNS